MKTAILTDSSSGITQAEAKEMGIYVLPMPFYINDELLYEEIDLSYEMFYKRLEEDVDIKTSQPLPGDVMDMWDKLLKEYDEIVYIPLSSGLSGSCASALLLADDYDGKVEVVNNQRVSVTLYSSVRDAKRLADAGKSAKEIKEILEATKFDSGIYIMIGTMEYLKKGGRLTPAAAAIATILRIKPVLQIQGEKLDSYAKVRTVKQGCDSMIDAVEKERNGKLNDPDGSKTEIFMAYGNNLEEAEEYRKQVAEHFGIEPSDIRMNPLALNIACHIGPSALAVAITKKLDI